MLSAERLEELLREIFHVIAEDDRSWLQFVSAAERSDGGLSATLHLVNYERDEQGQISILQIREQPVLFVPLHARDEEQRVAAFARALVRVLPQAMVGEVALEALPCDLVPANALMLARAEVEEDFVRALTAKSRLGRYLQRER